MRYKEQLCRQLRFIERSSAAFDKGFLDEAIRIAITIRVLIHQTKNSKSLLHHLGARSTVKILSSIAQPDPSDGVLCLFDGVMELSMDGPAPNLELSRAKAVDVETWWNEIAVVTGPEMPHTRQSIVCTAADKDGGAHVDEALTQEYEELMKGMYSFTKSKGNAEECRDIGNHQFFALRVFANELLNSPELQALAQ